MVPSQRPTILEEGLYGALSEAANFTNLALIETPLSPQYLAFQFLRDTTHFSIHTPQRIVQRYAMAVFYHATNGQGWAHSTNWMGLGDECLWHNQDQAPCNDQGELTRLVLSDNNLIGELPDELGLLSSLVEIELRGNGLVGQIPSTLGMLLQLENLDLSWNNQLGGIIPSHTRRSNLSAAHQPC